MRASWEDAAVDHGSTREGSLRYRLSRALESHALRRVDAVTTICEGLKADIVSRGVAPRRVTVIPNAVDPQAFAFGAHRRRGAARASGPGGATVVGFAGSFYAYEGPGLAARRRRPPVAACDADLRVLLVGGGPQEAALREQAARSGLRRSCGVHRARAARRGAALLRADRRARVSAPLDAADRAGHAAETAGGHGAGPHVRRLRRRRPPRADSRRRNRFLFRAGDADALAQAIDRVLAERPRWDGDARGARGDYVESRAQLGAQRGALQGCLRALVARSGRASAGINAAPLRG